MQVALRINGGCLLAALLFSSPPALAADPVDRIGAMRVAQASPAAMAEYRRLLAQYLAARQQYEAVAESYWNAVADKRRLRMAKTEMARRAVVLEYKPAAAKRAARRRPAVVPQRIAAAR